MPVKGNSIRPEWVVLLALAVLLSPARAQETSDGAKIARKYCSRCHSIGASGRSPHPSAPPFRQIAAKGHVDDLQEALAEGIIVGHPAMPEFAFQPQQIGDFLAYLKGLAPDAK